ncbi:MAG: hypothetical protein ACLRT5_02990 [Lachnospiraceae bacterium]
MCKYAEKYKAIRQKNRLFRGYGKQRGKGFSPIDLGNRVTHASRQCDTFNYFPDDNYKT